MPQSLARLHMHLIFSTKNRNAWISNGVREALYAYLASTLSNLGCKPMLINSVEDHVHLLFDLARTVSVSRCVEDLKKASSKWIKTMGPELAGFAWQTGYGIFAVSESNVEPVREYIAKQREHHQKKSFQDEYRQILERHRIVFDERYLWD